MSVIAWDGKILVADRQVTNADMLAVCNKAKRISTGEVLAYAGDLEQGLCLARWYELGASVDKWPKFQEGDDWTKLIVASEKGVFVYEKIPEKQPVHNPFMAWGSGRDFAMGAMAMGADAIKAVHIANSYSIYCGEGCEVFRFSETSVGRELYE